MKTSFENLAPVSWTFKALHLHFKYIHEFVEPTLGVTPTQQEMFFVNSVLLAYDAASLRNRFLTFIKGNKCLHFEGSRDPRRMTAPEEGLIQILGDGGTTYLEGVGSHLLSAAVSYPRRRESSSTPLWEPQNSHVLRDLIFDCWNQV